MRGRSTIEPAFAAALRDPSRAVPAGVVAASGRDPSRGFAVYRNNVMVGLVDALAARFPAVQSIVGEAFFRAMARVYVADEPPETPVLLAYGDGFPAFVAAFEPAAGLPYLADVARLEALRSIACHAADARPLDAAAFASVSPARLGNLRLLPHPAVRLLRSPHPVVSIWAMNAGLRPLGPIAGLGPEDALIRRPRLDVFVSALPAGAFAFLSGLASGWPLGRAAAAALAEKPDFDLAAALAALVGDGLVSGLDLEERSDGHR